MHTASACLLREVTWLTYCKKYRRVAQDQKSWFELFCVWAESWGGETKHKGRQSPTTCCSDRNISPISTNCIIQFPSAAVRDNKAGKCECKCSGTWCVIGLLIACLLQNCCWGFGAISQSSSRWGNAPSPPPSLPPRSCVLHLPSCVYVLRQGAAVSSPSFGWEMESSSAGSHRCGPSTIWRGGGC